MEKTKSSLDNIEDNEDGEFILKFPDKSYRFSSPVPRYTGPEGVYNLEAYKKIQENEQLSELRRGA